MLKRYVMRKHTNFNAAIRIEKHIIRLDVTMDDASLVQVKETTTGLSKSV